LFINEVKTKRGRKMKLKKEPSQDENSSIIFLPDDNAKIAEYAYYRAENRGFEPGYELEDWYEAEREFMQ
jgi:hypothetical protein